MQMRIILPFISLLIFHIGHSQCPFPVTLKNTGNCAGATLTVSTSSSLSKIDWYNGASPVKSVTATAPAGGVTVAGNNGVGYAADQLNRPYGVFVDAAGNVYVADQENYRIQKWAPGATSGVTYVGMSSTIGKPTGIFIDANGYLYVSDDREQVKRFPPGSNINTIGDVVAGDNGQGYAANQLNTPRCVFVDAAGNLYVADSYNYRVQKFPPGSTSATNGITVAGGPGDPLLAVPVGIFIDAAGNLYVSDVGHNQVLKYAPNATTGVIVAGGNGSGPAANQLNAPCGVFVDNMGNLYVADEMNTRIQKFPPGSTSASNGVTVAGGNGAGTAPNQISYPFGLWVDGNGNIYCSDLTKHSVQKWGQQPVIDSTYIAVTAGTYTAVVTDNSGCTVTPNNIVIFPVVVPDVSIGASATTICAGAPVTFTATPVNGGGSPGYQWLVNGVSTGNYGVTFTSNTLTNGDVVQATMASNELCPSKAIVSSNALPLTVNALVTPSISISTPATTVCSGIAVTFSATQLNGGNNPVYQWQVNGTNTATNSVSYTTNGLVNGDIVTCTLTSNATCAAPPTVHSNSVPVKVNATINPTVSIDGPANPVCEGDTVRFSSTVTNGGNNPVYQWQVNGINAGSSSDVYSSNRLRDGDVIICHYSSNGGCGIANSNSMPLTVHALPIVDAGQDISISIGTNVTLTPLVTGNVLSYLWTPGATLSDNTIVNPVASPKETTTYTLTVTGDAGCKASDDLVISVLKKLGIPNGFTPNGDSRNDIFYILGGPEGSRIKNFAIFNRWGQKVFQVQDVLPGKPAFGWNGILNGEPAPAGLYIYMVTMTFKDGTKQEMKGTLLLMR